VAQLVKYERNGKTQYEVDCGDVHLKLIDGEGTSAFWFHLTNAAIENSWLGRVERFEVFKSSAEWMRQSGWRFRFPETLLTVPDIGWSHWSQIIRMLFTSTWKGAHQIGRVLTSAYHFLCQNRPGSQNANIANNASEKDKIKDSKHVKVKRRSDKILQTDCSHNAVA